LNANVKKSITLASSTGLNEIGALGALSESNAGTAITITDHSSLTINGAVGTSLLARHLWRFPRMAT